MKKPETLSQLAAMIDHTILRPDADASAIEEACRVAVHHKTASICVSPNRVQLAAKLMDGSGIPVCSVVAFPSGQHTQEVKHSEALDALQAGAQEIDMVINRGLIKDRDWDGLAADIGAVRKASVHCVLKVILETAELDEFETRESAHVAIDAGADFLKTSTGFGKGGATIEAVTLLSEMTKPTNRVGVKASGGIRDANTTLAMISAGATRIGASATEAILREFKPD